MVKPRFGPAPFVVTLLALLTFLPLVYIVATMAGITCCFQFFPEKVAFVTSSAFDLFVRTTQTIFRYPPMLEQANGPVTGRMTTFTFTPEFATVIIVLFMAGTTGFGCVFMILRFMAVATGNIPMLADKRIIRFFVVKPDFFPV